MTPNAPVLLRIFRPCNCHGIFVSHPNRMCNSAVNCNGFEQFRRNADWFGIRSAASAPSTIFCSGRVCIVVQRCDSIRYRPSSIVPKNASSSLMNHACETRLDGIRQVLGTEPFSIRSASRLNQFDARNGSSAFLIGGRPRRRDGASRLNNVLFLIGTRIDILVNGKCASANMIGNPA